jgi:hypothetical protein
MPSCRRRVVIKVSVVYPNKSGVQFDHDYKAPPAYVQISEVIVKNSARR